MRRVMIAALTVMLAATAARAESMALSIPSQTVPDARPSPQPLPAQLTLPPGAGPFPVVILLHGCGGLGNGAEMQHWVERVTGWGYAALVMDSLTPRGVSTVCAPANQPLVTAQDRAGDVVSAALYLRGLPKIDGRRITVIGFSHGGGTVVQVTRKQIDHFVPGLLRAAVDYYGPCRQPKQHGTVPLLVLAGDDDNWGNPAKSCTALGTMVGPDQPFELHVYPGVVHAFDNPALIGRRFSQGHPMQYDEAAARDSFARVRAFLERWDGPRQGG
jgi:dienelactone hydrolase